MYKLFALAFLSLFLNSALAAEPFEFKGVPLGTSEAEAVGKLTFKVCSRDRKTLALTDECAEGLTAKCEVSRNPVAADRSCIFPSLVHSDFRFAGVFPENVTLHFIGDRLMHVSLLIYEPSSYEPVVATLTQAYGQPAVSTKELKSNASGAVVGSARKEWRRGKSTIRVVQRYERKDFSRVEFFLDDYPGLMQQRQDADAKKRAKDI